MVDKAKMRRVMPKPLKATPLGNIRKESLILPNYSGTEKFLKDKAIAKWKLNGTSAYYNDGNVGIGTSTPEGMLTIGTNNPTISLGNTGTSANDALIGRAGENNYHVTGSQTGDLAIRPQATSKIIFGTTPSAGITGTARMTINNLGNVGIGTTNPQAKLHAVQTDGNVNPSLTYNSSSAYIFNTGGADLAMGILTASPWSYWMQARASSSVSLPISINPLGGNVGIGTTTPALKFQVKDTTTRSEERRVGKECRSRWSPDH